MKWAAIWQWLQDKEHRAAVSFLAGGVAALVVAGWTAYVYFDKELQEAPIPPTQSPTEIGVNVEGDLVTKSGGKTYINAPDGTIIIKEIHGIPPEIHAKLAKQFDVTEAALSNFFKILEREKVPSEELDSTLRDIASRYKELEERLTGFTSDDPEVSVLKKEARQALDAGELKRAEARVEEALLEAAQSAAKVGALKAAELAYAEAARHYRKAAQLLPADKDDIRGEYLDWEGCCGYRQGGTQRQRPLSHRRLRFASKCWLRRVRRLLKASMTWGYFTKRWGVIGRPNRSIIGRWQFASKYWGIRTQL